MNKNLYFIIVIIIIIGAIIVSYNCLGLKEHMVDTSTCPCNVDQQTKDNIGNCKCDDKSEIIKTTHGCPADRTYGIVPPLLVEPRMILTDNSMRCHEYNNPTDGPSGYMDDEMSKFDTNLEHIDRLYSNDNYGDKIYVDNSYSMSTMKTGLPSLTLRNMDTCLTDKVMKKCGNKLIK